MFDSHLLPVDKLALRVVLPAPDDGITSFDASVLQGQTFDLMPSYSNFPGGMKDWRGFRFGRMTVVELGFFHFTSKSGKRPNIRQFWVCRCTCGRYEYRRTDRIQVHKNKGDRSLASCRVCSVARTYKER